MNTSWNGLDISYYLVCNIHLIMRIPRIYTKPIRSDPYLFINIGRYIDKLTMEINATVDSSKVITSGSIYLRASIS